jgi:hypothetical protein
MSCPQLPSPARACSFCPPTSRTDRRRAAVGGQAGNAMHVNVCGALWFYIMLYIRADTTAQSATSFPSSFMHVFKW